MNRKNFQKFSILLILLAMTVTTGCGQNSKSEKNANEKKAQEKSAQKQEEVNYKVTFIELGSERCIPCQKMQPIMKSIEEKYPDQVNVVFHDVWTPEGKPYARKYNIKVIPTQVFLDENGKEYFRHKGFFPEEELEKVLKRKGVK